MGRQVFTAGEILTAANMNDLSDQTVMVFDDDDARATAIPAPSAGMVTYRVDADALEKFNGSDFVDVSPGGLIAVKDVLKTDTFSASVTAGNNVAVTGLSITHEVQDPANRLILTAVCGFVATSDQDARTGVAIDDGSGFISTPLSPGSRSSVMMAGRTVGTNTQTNLSHTLTAVTTPGAGSKTYSVKLINNGGSTNTLFLNRQENDIDDIARSRGVSTFMLMEVAV